MWKETTGKRKTCSAECLKKNLAIWNDELQDLVKVEGKITKVFNFKVDF